MVDHKTAVPEASAHVPTASKMEAAKVTLVDNVTVTTTSAVQTAGATRAADLAAASPSAPGVV